ncbi:hypothetical protein EDC96DRAFT_548973 [Choanephora cucurbitarum]|nr:hypothetical protein EDC96DRAFT_548973 [Choanephora cucurbitarum]
MNEEMGKLFHVGKEFSDSDKLRILAQELGRKYLCPITTDKSSQKEQKIGMICRHGKVYRQFKKVSDADPVNNDNNSKSKENKKESLKFDCPCVIEAKLSPVRKAVTVRCVDGSHSHRIVNDPPTYHSHRKLDADVLEKPILLLQKNNPFVVLGICVSKLSPE